MSRSEHSKNDARRLVEKEFMCLWCNTSFKTSGRKLGYIISNRRKGRVGPFCGRSCAGKYGAEIQNNRCKLLPVINVTPEYTTNKILQSPCVETRKVDGANSGKP